jgi:hypothetical protein
MISDDLRRQADHFIDLMSLRADVGREMSERPGAPMRRHRSDHPGHASRRRPLKGSRRGSEDSHAAAMMQANADNIANSSTIIAGSSEPDCALCPRLHGFIDTWRHREPDWFNGRCQPFCPGDGAEASAFSSSAWRPAARGANRTGRPFTGDFAGDLLYSTLGKFGFSKGATRRGPTMASNCRHSDHQRGALRAARKQASSCRNQHLPAIPGARRSVDFRISRDCDARRNRTSVNDQGARGLRIGAIPVQAWRALRADGVWRYSRAITARATTPIPAF